MKLVVTEDTEIVVDGQRMLLEKGDQVSVNENMIAQLKKKYKEYVMKVTQKMLQNVLTNYLQWVF